MKKRTNVLVAGAGPVGLLTGILLRRQGIDVEVVDKGGRTATRAYALALHPQTMDLFDEIGIGDAVRSEGRRLERITFAEDGAQTAELDLATTGTSSSVLYALPQSTLERILEDTLHSLGTKVNWGHRLAGMEAGDDSDRVRARVEKLGSESLGYTVSATVQIVLKDLPVEADFVLAADGHSSLARQRLGIDFPEVAEPQSFAVFELSVNQPLSPEAHVFFHDDTTNVLWPLPDNRCRFSFELRDAIHLEQPRVKSRLLVQLGLDAVSLLPEGALDNYLKERAPWFDRTYDDIRWSMIIKFEQRLATRFGRGRVWLLGDAAHIASPVMCRSMNLGFLEAKRACRTVARILQDGEPISTFESEREASHRSWCDLWRSDVHVHAASERDDWLTRRAKAVMSALPGTGADHRHYAMRMGLVAEAPHAVR